MGVLTTVHRIFVEKRWHLAPLSQKKPDAMGQ